MPIEVSLGAIALYTVAALQQLRENVVANWLCAAVVALGLYRWTFDYFVHGNPSAPASAGWAVGAAFLVFLLLLFIHSRGWIGGGAVKLAAATPILIGAPNTPLFLLLGAALSFLLALLFALRSRLTDSSRSSWIGLRAGVPVPVAIGLAALAVLAIEIERL
jgi:Flp pilus assembly protein protease CpaA